MNELIVVKAIRCDKISASKSYISIKANVNTIVGMPDSMINASPTVFCMPKNNMHSEAKAGPMNSRMMLPGMRINKDFHFGNVNAIPTEIIMIGGTAFPAISET
jgi:hypothetical protein